MSEEKKHKHKHSHVDEDKNLDIENGEGEKVEDAEEINWEEKAKEFEHKYKLALADYQNLLKRTAGEKQEFAKFANEQLIMEILPVYDNLKVSMDHIDEAAKQGGWAQGIKYVIKQFADVLRMVGIEEIEAEGKDFDHNTMEALEGQGEKVKKVMKSGYKLREKVIVPAKVILE